MTISGDDYGDRRSRNGLRLVASRDDTPSSEPPFDLEQYDSVANYIYTTASGRQITIVKRFKHKYVEGVKLFRQYRPDDTPGEGSVKVPYHWPQLIAAPDATVYYPEGEKDVETCEAHGLVATTAAGQQLSTTIVHALKGRNVVILVDNDDAGEKNAAKAVEAFRRVAKSLKVVRLPDLEHGEDVTDWFEKRRGTPDKLKALVEAEPCLIEEAKRGAIRASRFQFCADTEIPWPDFLYGTAYIRGVLSITASAGGQGKSLLMMTEALAMATGKPLLGLAPQSPLRVWYVNLEDGDNVLVPRLAAGARYHELSNADIGDRLFVDNSQMKIVLAREDERRRAALDPAVVAQIIRTINEKRIDVMMIDPLVSAHRIPENDNGGIDLVAKALSDIASQTNCSLMVAHHMAKGKEERTSDNVRGASALVNAARVVRVLNPMAKEDADKAAVEDAKRGFYFSVDDGKTNLAPAEKRTWFQRVSYEEFSFDDRRRHVVVLKPFAFGAAQSGDRLANLTEADIRAAFREGGPWRERGQSDMWAGYKLAAHLELGAGTKPEKDALQRAIGRAVNRGWLVRFDHRDGRREVRPHVKLPDFAAPSTSAADIEGAAV